MGITNTKRIPVIKLGIMDNIYLNVFVFKGNYIANNKIDLSFKLRYHIDQVQNLKLQTLNSNSGKFGILSHSFKGERQLLKIRHNNQVKDLILNIAEEAGKVDIYTNSNKGGFEFIGSDNIGQVPKGESSKIQAGYAFDITGKRKVINYDRQRKSEEAVIEIKVTNARIDEVEILLVEHINGDWIIKDPSLNYQKKDASTIHFVFSVQAGETKSVYYTYRKEWK